MFSLTLFYATFKCGHYNVFNFFPHKNLKKPASKVAHIWPKYFFFSNANLPKSSQNLNSCSIEISHRGTSL